MLHSYSDNVFWLQLHEAIQHSKISFHNQYLLLLHSWFPLLRITELFTSKKPTTVFITFSEKLFWKSFWCVDILRMRFSVANILDNGPVIIFTVKPRPHPALSYRQYTPSYGWSNVAKLQVQQNNYIFNKINIYIFNESIIFIEPIKNIYSTNSQIVINIWSTKYKLKNWNLVFILHGFTKEAGLKCTWFRLNVGNL